jgi:ribonuclease D
VGLGPLVESVLGLTLEKGHSAADWSQRPLPEPLLRYAALDVEVLVELRDALEADLDRQGKLDWAREEFAAVLAAPLPQPRPDRWRRTSGIHRVRTRRQLAVVRALWEARDTIARQRDLAPGRVLPDSSLVAAAVAMPKRVTDLVALPGFTGRGARRFGADWQAAIDAALALPDDELPGPLPPNDGPPPASRWPDRDPPAAARLAAVREALRVLSEELAVPVENLLSPDAVRRLAWTPPDPPTEDAVAAALIGSGARGWQARLTAGPLAEAMRTG